VKAGSDKLTSEPVTSRVGSNSCTQAVCTNGVHTKPLPASKRASNLAPRKVGSEVTAFAA
jgi:hypothetical protein